MACFVRNDAVDWRMEDERRKSETAAGRRKGISNAFSVLTPRNVHPRVTLRKKVQARIAVTDGRNVTYPSEKARAYTYPILIWRY